MGDSPHPFAPAGHVLDLATVQVNSVYRRLFGNIQFYFNTNIVGYDAVADSAFEVYRDGFGWSPPSGFSSKLTRSITYNYPIDFWQATHWRILLPPTHVWWLPDLLDVPASGDILVE